MHETGDVRYTRRYAVAQCVAVLFVCATLLVTHRSLHVQQPKLPHEPRAALPLQQEPLQHEPSSYRVCHFARTELRSSAFTATFRDYAVRFLWQQSVQSLVRQVVPPDVYYEVIVSVSDELVDLTGLQVEHSERVRLSLTRSDWRSVMMPRLREMQHQCEMYATTILDADDVVADGLVRTVRDEAVQLVPQGFQAAVIGAPHLAHLLVAFGRCGILNRPDEQRELFYAGWSVGQTIVASADIVHAGYLKEPHNYGLLGIWGHTHLLHRVRDRVLVTKTGNQSALSLIKEQPTFFSTGDEEKLQEFLDIDSFNAKLTGVKMIHKRGLGLYMATPLSSHFPWKRLDSLPVCDEQQQAKVKETVARFGYDSGRIDLNRALGEAQDGVRIMDACLSNTHFVRSQHKQFRLFRAHNSSCSELDGVSIPVADDWWARRGEQA
ncbi:MAG: hypothetical protein MHM6MM_001054 [Cercozoa sp. M6MM]